MNAATLPRRLAVAPLLIALLTYVAACGDGGGTGPEPDPEPEVTDVRVTPTAATLTLGEEVRLDVVVELSDGSTRAPASVQFTSSDPSVASVDDSGVVTGVAEGTARIDVVADGRSAAADVVVETRTAENVVVVDSTAVRLVSTPEQRAAGELRFVGGSASDFAVGEIVVGDQSAGFLRRVTSVEARGDTVVLQTESAALDEVVEGGSFQTTVSLDAAQAAPVVSDGVRWSGTDVVYAAPGVRMGPDAVELSGTVLGSGEVCQEQDGVTVCGKITVDVPHGVIEFTPDVDIGMEYSWLRGLTEFHAVGSGNLLFDMDARVTAQLFGEFQGEKKLGTVRRYFWGIIGGVPVAGQIYMDIIAGFHATAHAEGSVTSGATASASVSAGARYENGGWTPVFESGLDFETRPLVWEAEAGASVRVNIHPVFTLLLYEAIGPQAAAIPWLKFDGEVDIDECRYEGTISAGVDLDVAMVAGPIAHRLEDFQYQTQGPSGVLLRKEGALVERLLVVGGDGQKGPPGEELPGPLSVVAIGEDGEETPAMEVTFEVTAGSGEVAPTSVFTDLAGGAEARWTLGAEEGTQEVTTKAPRCADVDPVVFTAEAVAEEDDGPTGEVVGRVALAETTGITALAAATVTPVRVSSAEASATSFASTPPQAAVEPVTTDSEGFFTLEALPVGEYRLVISRSGVVETTVFGVHARENQTTVVGPVTVVRTSTSPGTLELSVLRSPSDEFPVPNAVVELRHGYDAPDTESVVVSGTTGGSGSEQGELTLSGVPAGTYTARVRAPGGGVNREIVFVIGGATLGYTIYVHP